MPRANMRLHPIERDLFNVAVHMFPTNNLVSLHNRHMLKSLNSLIARCIVKYSRRSEIDGVDYDQLDREVLLCHDQRLMLTRNLWVEAGLVNGALGFFKDIFYPPTSKQPRLPMFTTIGYYKYVGVPFDASNPNVVPITPVIRGNRKQIPLKMEWALIIHKSQGLTLERASVDIKNKEQRGLTFTTISRVKSIDGLHIAPPFSFQCYAKMKNSAYIIIRKKEEEQFKSISL